MRAYTICPEISASDYRMPSRFCSAAFNLRRCARCMCGTAHMTVAVFGDAAVAALSVRARARALIVPAPLIALESAAQSLCIQSHKSAREQHLRLSGTRNLCDEFSLFTASASQPLYYNALICSRNGAIKPEPQRPCTLGLALLRHSGNAQCEQIKRRAHVYLDQHTCTCVHVHARARTNPCMHICCASRRI